MSGFLGAALALTAIGFAKLGWSLMDRHLTSRRDAREAGMKNITPPKEK